MHTHSAPSSEPVFSQPPAQAYLQDLHSLAGELETAMEAVSSQRLQQLEDSLRRQRATCARLTAARPSASSNSDLAPQIQDATLSLQALNLRYAALVEHFGGTLRLFASLARSHSGAAPSGGMPGKIQTWSCEL